MCCNGVVSPQLWFFVVGFCGRSSQRAVSLRFGLQSARERV